MLEPDWIRDELSRALARLRDAPIRPRCAAPRARRAARARVRAAIEPADAALVYRVDEQRAARAARGRRRLPLRRRGRLAHGRASSRPRSCRIRPPGRRARSCGRSSQDLCLPVAAYVGGCGELAYHAQLAPLRAPSGAPLTPFVPRISCTLVEPEVRVSLAQLGHRRRERACARAARSAAEAREPEPPVVGRAARDRASAPPRELLGARDRARRARSAGSGGQPRRTARARSATWSRSSPRRPSACSRTAPARGAGTSAASHNGLFPRGTPQERVLGPLAVRRALRHELDRRAARRRSIRSTAPPGRDLRRADVEKQPADRQARLLVIAAHPDDAEISRRRNDAAARATPGKRVGVVDLTRGEMGTRGTADGSRRARRGGERAARARRARQPRAPRRARRGRRSRRASASRASCASTRPTSLLAHHVEDLHPDHAAAGALAREAWYLSGLARLAEQDGGAARAPAARALPLHGPRALRARRSSSTSAPVWERKVELVRCYASQLAPAGAERPRPAPPVRRRHPRAHGDARAHLRRAHRRALRRAAPLARTAALPRSALARLMARSRASRAAPERPATDAPAEPGTKGSRMRRIALINQKGGVGKTTTTVEPRRRAGAARTARGAVDLDPQANLSLHLGRRRSPAATPSIVHGADRRRRPSAARCAPTTMPGLSLVADEHRSLRRRARARQRARPREPPARRARRAGSARTASSTATRAGRLRALRLSAEPRAALDQRARRRGRGDHHAADRVPRAAGHEQAGRDRAAPAQAAEPGARDHGHPAVPLRQPPASSRARCWREIRSYFPGQVFQHPIAQQRQARRGAELRQDDLRVRARVERRPRLPRRWRTRSDRAGATGGHASRPRRQPFPSRHPRPRRPRRPPAEARRALATPRLRRRSTAAPSTQGEPGAGRVSALEPPAEIRASYGRRPERSAGPSAVAEATRAMERPAAHRDPLPSDLRRLGRRRERARAHARRRAATRCTSSRTTSRRASRARPGPVQMHVAQGVPYPLFHSTPHDLAITSSILNVHRSEGLDILHAHYALPHAVSAYLARSAAARRPRAARAAHGDDAARHGHHARRQRSLVRAADAVRDRAERRGHGRVALAGAARRASNFCPDTRQRAVRDRGHPELRRHRALPAPRPRSRGVRARRAPPRPCTSRTSGRSSACPGSCGVRAATRGDDARPDRSSATGPTSARAARCARELGIGGPRALPRRARRPARAPRARGRVRALELARSRSGSRRSRRCPAARPSSPRASAASARSSSHGVTGLLAAADDLDAFAGHLARAALRPRRARERMGARGARATRSSALPPRHGSSQRYEDLYRRAAGAAVARARHEARLPRPQRDHARCDRRCARSASSIARRARAAIPRACTAAGRARAARCSTRRASGSRRRSASTRTRSSSPRAARRPTTWPCSARRGPRRRGPRARDDRGRALLRPRRRRRARARGPSRATRRASTRAGLRRPRRGRRGRALDRDAGAGLGQGGQQRDRERLADSRRIGARLCSGLGATPAALPHRRGAGARAHPARASTSGASTSPRSPRTRSAARSASASSSDGEGSRSRAAALRRRAGGRPAPGNGERAGDRRRGAGDRARGPRAARRSRARTRELVRLIVATGITRRIRERRSSVRRSELAGATCRTR